MSSPTAFNDRVELAVRTVLLKAKVDPDIHVDALIAEHAQVQVARMLEYLAHVVGGELEYLSLDKRF